MTSAISTPSPIRNQAAIKILMYSALAELAVDSIRILLIAYAVYDLSRYCIRTTGDPANPLLDFTSDYLGELARYI